MNDPAGAIVCDAGPLIHLDELDCLSFLTDFYPILVPDHVWQEVEHHRPGALVSPRLNLRRVEVMISARPTFQSLVQSLALDLGEQAALTLMQSHPDAILLTDDAAARLAATTLGYRVHGTIGILVRAIRRGQRSRADVIAILHQLPVHSSLHIRPQLLAEIIDQLNSTAADPCPSPCHDACGHALSLRPSPAVWPPSSTSVCPVMKAASSLARKANAPATSAVLPSRFSGINVSR